MRRRFFLIYNRAAGRDRRLYIDAVISDMTRAGACVIEGEATTLADARAEAAAAARSGTIDALIAAGGDGTVRQAAIAAQGTACPVGAVMMGTGNVLAHELRLPRAPDAVAAMLCNGPTVTINLARANDEPFLLMAGAGFDGRIVGNLNQWLKQRFARAAYAPATLAALRAPLDRLCVTIDGREHTCAWAIVTSAARYGGAFQLTRQTSVREPGLVAMLFRPRTRAELVAQAVALARGDLDRRAADDPDWVTAIPCSAADITASVPVPAQIDGDIFGTTPLHISSSNGQVDLIVPGGEE
jgi:diacylglycerol kinase (ATP)